MKENGNNIASLEFNLLNYNPGSAKGFNFGLRTMMRYQCPCHRKRIVNKVEHP
jgi:hypothetical protein